jgi:hypothetical protein
MTEVIVGPETVPSQVQELLAAGVRVYCTTILGLPGCEPLREYESEYVEVAEECAVEHPGIPVVDHAGLLQTLDICHPEHLIVVAPPEDARHLKAVCRAAPAHLSLVALPFTARKLHLEIDTALVCLFLTRL